tara:strand:- start:483 stop:659 length:177 start_codon:yes stop_codon:yes gene_type:complete
MIAAFETASGQQINYPIMPRRAGNIDSFLPTQQKQKPYLAGTQNVVSARCVRILAMAI